MKGRKCCTESAKNWPFDPENGDSRVDEGDGDDGDGGGGRRQLQGLVHVQILIMFSVFHRKNRHLIDMSHGDESTAGRRRFGRVAGRTDRGRRRRPQEHGAQAGHDGGRDATFARLTSQMEASEANDARIANALSDMSSAAQSRAKMQKLTQFAYLRSKGQLNDEQASILDTLLDQELRNM